MRYERLDVISHVAELGSLSKAAKALGIAQSAVSRHIALLEERWGDRLFERTGRGVTLSGFGQRMLPQVRALLAQAQRLDDLAHEASGIPSGVVHVGMLPSITRHVIGQLMTAMSAKYPAVLLRITEGFSGALDEQVTFGHLDLAVINRYGRTAPRGEEVLARMDTYLVGRPGNPLLATGQITFSQLSKVALAVPSAPNGLRAMLDQIARRKRVQLNIRIEIDTISAIKDVVRQSDVCGLMPYAAVYEEARAGMLMSARVLQPSIPRTITVGITRQRPISRATRAVLSELANLVPLAVRKYGAPPT